ncbi:ATP-binding protein [Conexibacter sp. SYSU D00693]|uniref:ATP-binding protein n=1 Tax=Conexibacter sp. SYSU D00693 TaxID=2812560 RepID=UPI00196A261A|nr:ATP-binding protein [Conexibacter sp. SYSU D00693]
MDAQAPPAAQPLRRDPANGLVAGVCAGLAQRLGVDVLLVRVAAAVLTVSAGIAIPLYVLAWALLPSVDAAQEARAPRLRPGSFLIASGVACIALGALLAARAADLWIGDGVVFPVVLAAAGAALVWRQSQERVGATPDEPARPRDAASAAAAPAVAEEPPSTRDRAAALSRTGAGTALILAAGLLVLHFSGALAGARDAALSVLVVVAALALVGGPFALRAARTISEERAARIRSQERSEVAAHLHDSVLQTLALVQKQAGDPRAVAAIARRQERELRSWLAGADAARPDERLADALRAVAAEVEDDHGVPIEVVAVGDRPLDQRGEALVAAAREAMVNAAKHAGEAGPVQVFAEVEDGRAEVFVRDRGQGFDPQAVPDDRRGVRESILGRMTRHGGRATIHAAPGAGTEVELVLEDDPR